MQPRFIRLRDAAHYLGMDPNRFNREVRPYLVEIPIGVQGIAFDRLDLDSWAEHYKAANGRRKGDNVCQSVFRDLDFERVPGTLNANGSMRQEEKFLKVLATAKSKKRKPANT